MSSSNLLFDLRRQEGWTVLQVSHDLDMVRRSCDQVLCLNRRLRCSGSPDHALSPERLNELYGPNMITYQHQHLTPSTAKRPLRSTLRPCTCRTGWVIGP